MRTHVRATLLSSSIGLAVLIGLSRSSAQPPAAAAAQPSDSGWTEAIRWQHSSKAAAATPQLSDSDAKAAATAFWEGKHLYDSGRFEQALERFEYAYRLTKDPSLLYNLAQCHRRMRNCREARSAYQQFRDLAPDSPLVAQATEHLAAIETICPTTPAQPSNLRGVTVAAASESKVATTEATRPGSPSASKPRSTAPTNGESRRMAPTPKSVLTSTGQSRWYWILATATAGLVAGGTAVGVGLWNHNRQEHWRMNDALLAKGTAPGESDQQWAVRQQENDEFGQSIERANRTVVYLGVAGGALLTGSALLFFATRPSSTMPAATLAAPHKTWSIPILVEASSFRVLLQSSF